MEKAEKTIKNNPKRYSWSTEQEIAFIDKLGYNRHGIHADRMNLLVMYRDAARRRKRWGNINRAAVLKHVKAAIRAERYCAGGGEGE